MAKKLLGTRVKGNATKVQRKMKAAGVPSKRAITRKAQRH